MQDQDFWVFGYGSLLWKPGFEYEERRLACLSGFHRSFCMHSIHYRGTSAAPGLVLALDVDAQAECHGVGFHVAESKAADTLAYLRERELISSAYMEQWHDIVFHDGGTAKAVCYVIDRGHVQYAGGLPLQEQAVIIANAVGDAGPNIEYLLNTVSHLNELGIADKDMNILADLVGSAD